MNDIQYSYSSCAKFTCNEKINLTMSNVKCLKLALKETQFTPSNDFQKGRIDELVSQSESFPRIEIIDSLIQVIELAEKHDKEPQPFINLFYYLSEKFEYSYTLDCENPCLMTCYKYNSAGIFDKISVPVSRIKHIIQHDRIPLGGNSSIGRLSRSRVSCVTETGEEFRIHPVSNTIICFMSDEVYKGAIRHMNNVIKAI
ncbi:hypothetical protein AB1287_17580 [Enterobacter asburiae]|uniref:hypothetical protein n=1 Tax=Scandinavium sp. UTDF21-P1B TaxID=3446379 RepID=UPI0034857115